MLSAGSGTQAAAQIATRLKSAGYPDSDILQLRCPEHAEDGGLVAILKGNDAKLKPMLLLAHLDVVEAEREDWQRDPFTLIRFKQSGYKSKRTIKLALTCGEETTFVQGRGWLAKKAVATKHLPGLPMLPLMSIGATGGIFLEATGIPHLCVPGIFLDPDFGGIHGLNERVRKTPL